jgi:hypothetical protein
MSEDSIIIDETNPISEEEPMEEVSNGPETEQQEPETKIPEKFQGKSMEDLVEMYTNLEKDHSRLGNEVGENRKLVDELLKAELNRSTSIQTSEPEPDWTYEPDKAAEKLIQTEVGAVKQELDKLKQKAEITEFVSSHSDFMADSQTQEYMDWVVKSPYRTKLHDRNVSGFDPESATELAESWREYKELSVVKEDTGEAQRKQDLKAASLETGASSGGSRKKMWSRAYIRHLRMNEPSKYEANKKEIMEAYDDGRITK